MNEKLSLSNPNITHQENVNFELKFIMQTYAEMKDKTSIIIHGAFQKIN
jgi:hypothetical protein